VSDDINPAGDSKYGRQFLDSYLQAMGGAWHSLDDEARLLADPTAYAIEKGLPVEAGAVVRLDRTQPDGLYTADQLVHDWTATPGEHILHIPTEELIADADLSDEDLELVAGGDAAPGPNNINVNVACYVG
jgi:hypothetical protein